MLYPEGIPVFTGMDLWRGSGGSKQEKRTTKMLASRLSNSLRAAVGRRAIGGFALPTDAGATVAEKVCVCLLNGGSESERTDGLIALTTAG